MEEWHDASNAWTGMVARMEMEAAIGVEAGAGAGAEAGTDNERTASGPEQHSPWACVEPSHYGRGGNDEYEDHEPGGYSVNTTTRHTRDSRGRKDDGDYEDDEDDLDSDDDRAFWASGLGKEMLHLEELSVSLRAAAEARIAEKQSEPGPTAAHAEEEPQFTCHCCFTFKAGTMEELRKHVRLDHLKQKQFTCPHPGCGRMFFQAFSMRRHTLRAHAGASDTSTCPACGFEATDKAALRDHVTEIHGLEHNYACNHCDFRTHSSRALARHKNQEHLGASGELPCTTCGRFVAPERMWRHVKFVHPPPGLQHQCDICFETFKRPEYLKAHMIGVHEQRTRKQTRLTEATTPSRPLVPCRFCSRQFDRVYNVIRHEKAMHADSKTPQPMLKCAACEYTTPRKANLERHARLVHKQE